MSDREPEGIVPRRVVALLLVGLAPWTVVVYRGGTDFLFVWGLLTLDPLHAVSLSDWLFRYTQGPAALPFGLLAWPIGSALYVVALCSASLSLLGVEPRRVTAGLLVLAGVANLQVVLRFTRIGETVLPVGALLCWLLVWWFYRRDLRGLATTT